jgi:hypothetical protein
MYVRMCCIILHVFIIVHIVCVYLLYCIVCMYVLHVCLYAFMYCMHACVVLYCMSHIHACKYVCMYECTDICMRACTRYTFVYVCMRACMAGWSGKAAIFQSICFRVAFCFKSAKEKIMCVCNYHCKYSELKSFIQDFGNPVVFHVYSCNISSHAAFMSTICTVPCTLIHVYGRDCSL